MTFFYGWPLGKHPWRRSWAVHKVVIVNSYCSISWKSQGRPLNRTNERILSITADTMQCLYKRGKWSDDMTAVLTAAIAQNLCMYLIAGHRFSVWPSDFAKMTAALNVAWKNRYLFKQGYKREKNNQHTLKLNTTLHWKRMLIPDKAGLAEWVKER